MEILDNIKYFFRGLKSKILTPFRAINKFIQRGKNGYSGYDLWSLDYYMYTTLPKMIRDFEKTLHGSPSGETFEEVDNFDFRWKTWQYNEIIESMKSWDWFKETDDWDQYNLDDNYIRWRLILRRIAYCFEEFDEDLCSEKNQYKDEYFEKKFPKDTKDLFVQLEGDPKLYRINTNENIDKELEEKYWKREEEIANYRIAMKEEGFKLLSKYFECLWD
jgi:hypothetical protein